MLEQGNSPLFNLPTELRLRIYSYAFASIDLPLLPQRMLPSESRDFDGLLYSCKRVYIESRDERLAAITWLFDMDQINGRSTWPPAQRILGIQNLTVYYENYLSADTLWGTDWLIAILRQSSELAKLTIEMTGVAWNSSHPGATQTDGSHVLQKYQELAFQHRLKFQFEVRQKRSNVRPQSTPSMQPQQADRPEQQGPQVTKSRLSTNTGKLFQWTKGP